MESYQESAKVFKALCDPKRLAILEQLRSGEKCACVLQEPMDLTQSGLSYHMKILCDSGLVDSRQEGKWTHYRLSGEGRDKAVELLLTLTTPETEQKGGCLSCDKKTPS
nr:metalloregulator ArsR/SmtB family transcription factor [uncultured Acetatifactor sp.]